jgi:hypothetical protein
MTGMVQADLTLTHMDTGVRFGHASDERAFFEWLERIPCVASFAGEGPDGLVVRLKRPPSNDDLRQLLALCYRWGVDMRQLARFETEKNRSWFGDPEKYWHRAVFGHLAVDAALRLSAQRALLGAIGPDVRVIKVALDGPEIAFTVIASRDLAEAELDALSVAATEIVSDFPGHRVREMIIVSTDPLPPDDLLAPGWVYRRAE